MRLWRKRGFRVLANRFGFAGERGFVRFQIPGKQEARVGWDFCAFIEHEHVARHDFAVGERALRSFSTNGRSRFGEPPKREKRILRLSLLQSADERVEKEYEEDDSRIDPLARVKNNPACGKQDIDKRAFKLTQEDDPVAVDMRVRQRVPAGFLQAAYRFIPRESFFLRMCLRQSFGNR